MSREFVPAVFRSAPVRSWATTLLAAGALLLIAAGGSFAGEVVRVVIIVTTAACVVALAATTGRWAGAGIAAFGVGGVALGIGVGVRFTVAGELWWRGLVGLVVLGAGLVLIVAGLRAMVVGLARSKRVVVRLVAVPAALAVLWVVLPGVLATNVPPTALGAERPADFGLTAETVEYPAADGTRLSAWYVPSRNGAAVVLRHGAGSTRTSVLPQAAVLAEHGYGVLLADARGHGLSEGNAMDFGWNGDSDIAAAVSFLAERPEVDPARIGVVGMSMGGEEAIGSAAADGRIAAVVAEGATGRVAADRAWLDDAHGWRGRLQQGVEWLQSAVTDLLSDAPRPGSLATSVRAATDCRFLLIAGGTVQDEADSAAYLRSVAPYRVTVWVVPNAGHTAGLATDPAGWEAQVVGFLDVALAATPVP